MPIVHLILGVIYMANEMTLTVQEGKYGGVCLPSNEGSTGYYWTLPMIPNCINRTNDEWLAAMPGPDYPGMPGVHIFVFQGVTPTPQPLEMTFLLIPPGSQAPADKALCRVTVVKA
jgi:predicted secreted protein